MPLKLIDTHTHTQFAGYDADRPEVMRRCAEAGVGQIMVGTQKDTSAKAIQMANAYPNVWATVGLHPIHTDKSFHDVQELGEEHDRGPISGLPADGVLGSAGGVTSAVRGFTSRGEVFDYEYYKKLALDEHVVAIGECGLDFFHLEEDSVPKQKTAFEAQIALANDVKKPLMIHTRPAGSAAKETLDMKAYEIVYEMIKSLAKVHCHIHFYVGNWEVAEKFLNLGCTLSFNGVTTFARTYDETVRKTPLERILSETDAPYLAPAPHRGQRNESTWVGFVAVQIAVLKGLTTAETEARLLDNARKYFKLQNS